MSLWSPPEDELSASPASAIRRRSSSSASSATGAAKMKFQGQRIAQIARLKPEFVKEYKDCHARVWPEVLRQIRECNIEDYSIFHDADSGILFANFKYIGHDWEGDMLKMRKNEKVREWWRMTDGYQESLVPGSVSSEAGEPSWWKGLEEVFYFA